MKEDVATRLARVRAEIAEAALAAGRDSDDVALVAVTKTVPLERIVEAYRAGQRVFGENRVQEGAAKIEAAAETMPDASWHLVGHLQTNKAKSAARLFHMVQSLDSRRVAEALDRQALRLGRTVPALLEVNVGGEASKSGLAIESLWSELSGLLKLPNLQIRGLMTVAPLVSDPEEVRPVFRALREMRDEAQHRFPAVDLRELSMGMSGDFRVAVEEGATMVRIGRAIFGERPTGTG